MRTYTATLKYNYALAKKVSMYYAQRQLGRSTIIIILLLVAGLGASVYSGYDEVLPEIIAFIIAGCLAIYFSCRYMVWRRWIDKLESMGKPEAEIIVNEDAFAVSSEAGSATIPWKRFTDLWMQKEYWLLFMGKFSAPITIPLEGVDPNVLAMIKEKVSESRKSVHS